jgi:hypothetical protein
VEYLSIPVIKSLSFGFLARKDLYYLALSVPDEGYSKNGYFDINSFMPLRQIVGGGGGTY